MFLKPYLRDEKLNGFFKQLNPGQYLFKQGAVGNSMFIIVHGIMQLFDESENGTHLVGTFGPNQFFGEKSLLSTQQYQRAFSALAQTKVVIMELALKDIPKIQSVIPDFMLQLFQSATRRLERNYYLIRILRTKEDLEKLVHCILYFYRSPEMDQEVLSQIPMTVEDLQYLIHIERGQIVKCLEELVKRSILTKLPNESYLLRDEKKLLRVIPELEKKLAA